MTLAIRTITRLQDADDAPALGAGQNGYALTWDNATGAFVATALFTGGLLATGATTGATSQAQAFTNGIIGPTWKPASDSTTALQMQNAAGTAILTVDTTNKYLSLMDSDTTFLFRRSSGYARIDTDTYGFWFTKNFNLGDNLSISNANSGGGITFLPGGSIAIVNPGGSAYFFGAGQLFTLESSTTAAQSAARVQALWNDATHATRKADLVLTAYDSGGEREGLRIRGDGSGPALGFFGVAPIARAVLATGAGATVDNVITALQNLGLVKQS